MRVSIVAKWATREAADIAIVPFWEGEKRAQVAARLELPSVVKGALETGDFLGKKGQELLLYLPGEKESRFLLLGLGAIGEVTAERLRTSYAECVALARKFSLTRWNLLLPEVAHATKLSTEEALQAIYEGIALASYTWNPLKKEKKPEESFSLQELTFVGLQPKSLALIKERQLLLEAVFFARDLINSNADDVHAEYLAQVAQELPQRIPSLETTVWDRARLEKEGMGLILAVNRGSSHEPRLIVVRYRGNPRSKDHTVLLGKAVTFDTGGLNLKPTGSMETMRCDMSGGATALATLVAAATLKLKVNVTAVVPAVENAIGSKSFKPGDVYVSYSGKSVEIGNTDAEGRLILADALTYAVEHLAPTRMIDLATLTGAIVIALGEEVAGLMSNDDLLANKLLQAGEATSELLWRLPLHAPYRELLKSSIADVNNVGGRAAGSITAALFLQEFVGKVPWAHLDIAGTAFQAKQKGYWPKNATGFGVRLLVHFLAGLKE